MNRLNELVQRLTPEQVKAVEDYAESLARDNEAGAGTRSKFINADALVGLLKGMGGDKTDDELIKEAWDSIIEKYDK